MAKEGHSQLGLCSHGDCANSVGSHTPSVIVQSPLCVVTVTVKTWMKQHAEQLLFS